jgi:DNA-binding response OmpR family regulator
VGQGTVTRVLVVEDDPILAGVLQEVLQDEGYCAHAASRAAHAGAAIRERWPDILLLDVHLPDLDGWTFLGACRQDAWAVDLPVVMLAAPRDGLPAEDPRVVCLPKPFDLDTLTRTVQQLVAGAPDGGPAWSFAGAGAKTDH